MTSCKIKQYVGFKFFLLAPILLILVACDLENSPEFKSLQKNDKKIVENNSKKPEKYSGQSYQGDLKNLNGLLFQFKNANSNLDSQSKERLKFAFESQQAKDWGSASKGFSKSASLKPTPDAILGYAMSQIMTNVHTPSQKESLDTKLRNFRDAIKLYQVAIDLGKLTEKPLSVEQLQTVKTNVTCLESFLRSPDPKFPTCKLVADALEASKIQ